MFIVYSLFKKFKVLLRPAQEQEVQKTIYYQLYLLHLMLTESLPPIKLQSNI